jgi:hypothetical protein
MKGDSHLCAPNYCRHYRPAAGMPQPVDTATSHLGFRCIIRAKQHRWPDVDAGRPTRARGAGCVRTGWDAAAGDGAVLVGDDAAGLVALLLALAIAVAGRSPARLVSFLALFWMTGGLLTLRFALAIRPRPGFRLGLAAAIAAVVGAGLVLLRDRLSGLVAPEVFVGLLGIAAVLTGLLRILGGFAARSGWDAAGPSAGLCSARSRSGSAPCCY